MNKLPTAEEFMTDEYQIKNYGTILLKPTQAAIEFAKLHVKAALKAAANNADTKCKKGHSGEFNEHWSVYKPSILNAYPESNIK